MKEEPAADQFEGESTNAQNSTNVIESTDQIEYPPLQQKIAMPRRGNKSRPKTDIFGQNVVVTQIDATPRSQDENP